MKNEECKIEEDRPFRADFRLLLIGRHSARNHARHFAFFIRHSSYVIRHFIALIYHSSFRSASSNGTKVTSRVQRQRIWVLD
jgi:hypothetical protein